MKPQDKSQTSSTKAGPAQPGDPKGRLAERGWTVKEPTPEKQAELDADPWIHLTEEQRLNRMELQKELSNPDSESSLALEKALRDTSNS